MALLAIVFSCLTLGINLLLALLGANHMLTNWIVVVVLGLLDAALVLAAAITFIVWLKQRPSKPSPHIQLPRIRWQWPLRWPITWATVAVPSGHEPAEPPMTDAERGMIAAYTEILDTDIGRLSQRVYVESLGASFAKVTQMGGYIDFTFNIWNTSILSVTVGEAIDGHIDYHENPEIGEGNPEAITLKDKPERHTPRALARHTRNTVAIRQYLLPEVAQNMIIRAKHGDKGAEILFDFKGVQVVITSKTPQGDPGPTTSLDIFRWQRYRVYSGAEFKIDHATRIPIP